MRIIKEIYKEILINNQKYPVKIIYKSGKKNISYRFKDGSFIITTPITVRYRTIEDGLIKFAPKLMSYKKREDLIGSDFLYLMGQKYKLDGQNLILDGDNVYFYKNHDNLMKVLKKWYLDQVTQLIHYYQEEMNITQKFNIHIRNMKTRYGSYSRKTQGLSISFELIHYDIEMSKAVVVHELSHYYEFNHGPKFYDLVLKYYPNYYNVHAKLRKGIVK